MGNSWNTYLMATDVQLDEAFWRGYRRSDRRRNVPVHAGKTGFEEETRWGEVMPYAPEVLPLGLQSLTSKTVGDEAVAPRAPVVVIVTIRFVVGTVIVVVVVVILHAGKVLHGQPGTQAHTCAQGSGNGHAKGGA